MSQENEDIVRAMYGGFNGLAAGGGVEAYVRERWDPACEYQPVEEIEPIRGHEALVRWNERWFEAWDECHAHVDELIVHDDLVMAVVDVRAVGAESGSRVAQRFFHVCECRDGRVWRMREYLERDEALEAAGLSR